MFDYPPDWTVQDRAREAAPGGIFVDVLDAAGKSMATLRTNIATKAECTQKYPYALMDSEALPALAQKGAAPLFVFEGRDDHGSHPSKPAPLSYGITSAPLPSGRSACPIFQFFEWPPGVAAFSGVYNAVATTPGVTPDVNTPEAYTATEEYDAIRQTITSLRPAKLTELRTGRRTGTNPVPSTTTCSAKCHSGPALQRTATRRPACDTRGG